LHEGAAECGRLLRCNLEIVLVDTEVWHLFYF